MGTSTGASTFVEQILCTSATVRHAPALIAGGIELTHAELERRVVAAADALRLPPRSLVVLEVDRSLDGVIAYLAIQHAGHVPLLAAQAHARSLAATWAAQALVRTDEGAIHVERCDAAPLVLHPDLALLLSTSGSTGAPKLVRLSHQNLSHNATAIATFLRLTPADRAITTLPLHYCYGLSVLHSHLSVGASVVITEASVVDPCFRRALDLHRVSNFAGVPHTFELLERSGFDLGAHPSLRFVTQAGGRMPAERVRRWAASASAADAELFVMYGQTEATARMAYLPPELAQAHPAAIGRPLPGGSFELQPHPAAAGEHEGELVYRGPNVMMGYASCAEDLGAEAQLDELHTGDLARVDPHSGLYEIIGRASRFVKPFGVRVDLERVQELLTQGGHEAAVAGDDDRLVVAVVDADPGRVRRELSALIGVPEGAVHVASVDRLPRTTNGKVDHGAVFALASDAVDAPPPCGVVQIYRKVLGVDQVEEGDTFVSLGGDSLSYVECSLALEAVLGDLPADWHLRTVAELGAVVPSRHRSRIDTTVVLRAVGICAVVATHMRLHRIPGGAHTLLAVVGYNFARFQLALDGPGARLRSGMRTAARVAVPTSVWIGVNMLVAGGYGLGALLLVNNYTGDSARTDGRWQYWFFETFVQVVALATVLVAIPAVERVERRAPFVFAAALLAPLVVLRFEWLQFGDHYNYLYRTHTVAWCFGLGWLVSRARTVREKALVTLVVLCIVPGFFGQWYREAFVGVAVLLLLWAPTLPMPRPLQRPVGVLAAASMWIFVVHWQLYPPLDRLLVREVAYVLTLAAGVVAWWTVTRLQRTLGPSILPRLRRRVLQRPARPVPSTAMVASKGG